MVNIKRTQIIAEVGVNHNGNINLAKELIEKAALAGADFENFKVSMQRILLLDMQRKQIIKKKANLPKMILN